MADYKGRIGNLIRDARKHRGLTQHQLAELLGTSQSAINRIEKGHQNLSLEMLARIGAALDSEIVALGAGPTHLRVDGPTTLSGSIDVKTSKNAGVAAQQGPYDAAQGRAHRGGQPPARGAQLPRRRDPLGG
jgi:UDP-N-acetylglucosamine 1-carboxyvinyltransferase